MVGREVCWVVPDLSWSTVHGQRLTGVLEKCFGKLPAVGAIELTGKPFPIVTRMQLGRVPDLNLGSLPVVLGTLLGAACWGGGVPVNRVAAQ